MRISTLALVPLIGGLTGAALALTVPRTAEAEKLPVDCSGRYRDCYLRKQCTRYNADHACTEVTSQMWYWYWTPDK